MPISFSQIPVTLRTPGNFIGFDGSQATSGLAATPARILVVGQVTSDASATTGIPIRVRSAEQAVNLFGKGSMLTSMIVAAKRANEWQEMWALPLSEPDAGFAAKGAVAFSGEPEQSGIVAVRIGGRVIRVPVSINQSAVTTAAKFAAAITAAIDLPVTATIDAANPAKVNLVVKWNGASGNGLDIRTGYGSDDTAPAGLAVTLTPFTGGAGTPDVEDPLAALGDAPFQYIAWPYTDNISVGAIDAVVQARWRPDSQIDGQVFMAATDDHGALLDLGATYNSEVLSILGLGNSPSPAWEIAAIYTAVAAFYLNQDPARPLQTLTLTGVVPPAETDRFTQAERNQLLYKGIATATILTNGTVCIERAVTTYQLDIYGNADATFLDVETLATLAFLRASLRRHLGTKFGRHKLASDGTDFAPNQPITTPKIIAMEILALASEWERAGLVERLDRFKEQLRVERDASDPNRVNAFIPPDLINKLCVIAGQVQFRV